MILLRSSHFWLRLALPPHFPLGSLFSKPIPKPYFDPSLHLTALGTSIDKSPRLPTKVPGRVCRQARKLTGDDAIDEVEIRTRSKRL